LAPLPFNADIASDTVVSATFFKAVPHSGIAFFILSTPA
jgi:hypothetical protein